MQEEIVSPPSRTPFIGAANRWFGVAQRTGLMRQRVLEREALMDRVAKDTGLTDFGDPWFEQPFDRLLDAVKTEARLNLAGEFVAEMQFEKVLTDRVKAQRWFARHPEILERALPRPVIVVGPMRSGTTRMHRLLAADRRFQHLRSFETISPVPPDDFTPGEQHDERIADARKIQRMARLANPRTLNIHPTGPCEPEEELGLLVNSFWGMKHEVQWAIPGYGRWSEKVDARPAYAQLARLLKLVSWSQQKSSLKPWILKTPQYMLDLDAVLDTFPDARFIFTHRDPKAVVGSAASLAWNQTIIYSDHADARAVGREWLHKTEQQIARMRKTRDRIDKSRMIDVHFEDMDRDWQGVMRRIYAFLGMEMEPAVRGMEHFMQRSRKLKRKPHRYSLGEFGIAEGEVNERLSDYIGRYGIRVEGSARRTA
ncbi:sulfotransferase family protein [Croceicoccus bisphenolivorans]|uniref:sulfotransferase family protein n=1 Tax=Croceicoccus bisphenolivorans TaxID=1783232 RepID=UPI000B1F595B|nr:sulfotransferase [Croceicoccus bisphenolivorans]